MKRLLFCLGLLVFTLCSVSLKAQSIVDSEEENFNHFYHEYLNKGKSAMPYAYIRESDVVWKTAVWRTIDFREKFNQFFYFPTQTDRNTQDRINLLNTVMKALENGEIEVFEDDDLNIPKDYETIFNELNREHQLSIPIYDEWDEEIGSKDTIVRDEFDPADVYSISLKEFWFEEKNDTRQKVRIVGMNFIYNYCTLRDGENMCSNVSMFWVPMDDMRVRNVLVKVNAYDENNLVAERSYDDIFIDRYFDSYVTRTSNRFNRTVSSYLTGTDAILESQRIEDEIFNIESDMWEY